MPEAIVVSFLFTFVLKRKTIKKGWKIVLVVFAVIVLITGATYLLSQSYVAQTYITQKIADKLSKQLKARIHIGRVDVAFFNKIILKNLWVEGEKNDTLIYTGKLVAEIDSFSIRKKFVAFEKIEFNKTQGALAIDPAGHSNFHFMADSATSSPGTPPSWNFYCKNFGFYDATFFYDFGPQKQRDHITIDDINFTIENFGFTPDSLVFTIKNMALNDEKEFSLENLSSRISIKGDTLKAQGLSFVATHSIINGVNAELIFPNDSLPPHIDISVDSSLISFTDLAQFIPSLKGMDQQVELSGRVYGNTASLKGKNITLRTGNSTFLNCDFYINGFSGFNNFFISLDLNQAQTDFNDMASIRLPDNSSIRHLSFPEPFYQSGILSYSGNFTGFLTDFVAYGTLKSKMGTVSTDLSFVPANEGNIKLGGKVATTNFKLGKLFQLPELGEITFDGEIKGIYNKIREAIQGTFTGEVNKIGIYGYNYQNISVDGNFTSREFDGSVNIDDPNLNFSFRGKMNLNPSIPEFDFDLDLKKANLAALSIDTLNQVSDLSLLVKANFSGNNIDNLNGSINIENGSYKNQNGKMYFNGIGLATEKTSEGQKLAFHSQFADGEIIGDYKLNSLHHAFREILGNYLPALGDDNNWQKTHNRFTYQFNFKNLELLSGIFAPGLTVTVPFLLKGNIDTDKKEFNLSGTIPSVSFNNLTAKNVSLESTSGKYFTARIGFDEIEAGPGLILYNLVFNSRARNNKMDTRITWNNFHDKTFSGDINLATQFIESPDSPFLADIDIKQSSVYLADSLWQIDPCKIEIDTTSVSVYNFNFHDKQQSVVVDGVVSEDNTSRLNIALSGVRLDQIDYYLQNEPTFSGQVNGYIEFLDLYRKPYFFSGLNIKNLVAVGQQLGDMSLVNKWDNSKSRINSEIFIENNGRRQLDASGYFLPQSDSLDFTVRLDHLPLVFLDKLIEENFSGFHGEGTGKVKIYGKPEKILTDGAVFCENAGLTIDFNQVHYTLNDSIKFAKDTIRFDKIRVYDSYLNAGIFDGTIVHDNLGNMRYNMKATSSKILALNTTSKDNDIFYGKVFADGWLSITGHGIKVNLDGSAKTLLGTNVNISLNYDEEAENFNFIQFVDKKAPREKEPIFVAPADTAMGLNFIIEATPDAKAQLIYNSSMGEIIKGQGEGFLKFGLDKYGDFTIFGDYRFEEGDYLFTLENVINKRFIIERGSTITWAGDPFNAKIDVSAVYKLKASLNEILVNNYENFDRTQRIPVNCKIMLKEDLARPSIGFEIDFPSVDRRIQDELQQYFNTDEEMNRQILSLLVMGQFYTPEYMRGSYETTSSNLIGTTASELFSNQLSNWLSQISNNVDVGFNYRPGSQVTNDEIELALSTQIFNDRVTLNGNIGNNVNPNGNNSSQLVGEFDLNVKLTNNGKLQLKAFNRSNNNLIYETSPYTQGIGFTFKEEYNSFGELLKKITGLFRKKDKESKSKS